MWFRHGDLRGVAQPARRLAPGAVPSTRACIPRWPDRCAEPIRSSAVRATGMCVRGGLGETASRWCRYRSGCLASIHRWAGWG